ncbi:MAG: hypothetical protein ACE37J_11535 [Pikeienuella sp.]|uniref:hypothetical protein n=1 Tax=Pikeienuella sp. TaxID=2831957 RepID=UPI00391BE6FC
MNAVLKFLCVIAFVAASLAATQSPMAMSATDTEPVIMNAEMSMAGMDCCPDMSAEECDELCLVPAHCAAKCMNGILGIVAQVRLFELSGVVDPTLERSLRARAMPPPPQPPKHRISAGA